MRRRSGSGAAEAIARVKPTRRKTVSRNAAAYDGTTARMRHDFDADEMRALVETCADWLWETDAVHRLSWLSEGFEKSTGIHPYAVLGRQQLDHVKRPAPSGKSVEEHLADLDARRPFRDFVYQPIHAGTDSRWISISGFPLFDASGEFTGYRGTARNVGEIAVPAGNADQGQATQLMEAMNVLEDAFCYYDRDDRLILYNEALVGMYQDLGDVIHQGVHFTEVLDAVIERGVWPTTGVSPEEFRRKAIEAHRSLTQAVSTFQLADGRWIMRRDMRTADGGTIAISTDITEMKRREAKLADAHSQSEQLRFDLERTLDSLNMGVVLLDADLNAQIINKAFYDIWKVSPDDVGVGKPFRALMDVNRHNGIYKVTDADWESYVASRLAEIRKGDIAPREFNRADGCTMIYSVTALSGGKRLVSYFDITEMKQREAELAAALERSTLADATINGINDPIFVKDHDLKFVFVNEAFAGLFGRKPSDMIGKKGADFLNGDEAAFFEQSERAVLATGEHYEVEEDFEFQGLGQSRIVRKDRIRTASGRDYVACSILDISERKRRETEVEEARLRLQDVLESLPAAVIIYDCNNRFVLANRNLQQILPAMVDAHEPGRPLADAIRLAHAAGYFRDSGDPDLDALYDSDPDAWVEGYCKRYDDKQAVFERRNPDGRWFKVFNTRTNDGTFIGVRVDITELKERERALNESVAQIELFKHVLDELPVSTYVKTPDLKLEFVNKAWTAMTGVPQEEALGKTDRDFFGEEGEGFAQRDIQVIQTGVASETEEELTHRDGTVRHLIAKKSRIIGRNGDVHLIGSSTEVSELKQRERDLEDAQRRAVLADRAKSEFLANMSHEIRTPMNGVLGMAELLAKTELDDKQKRFTEIIVKSGNALLTIINDILDFSKIDAGQLVLDPAPFNLTEAIEDVATLISTRAKEKDLEMIVRVQPGLPESYVGDAGRIRQIVTNLLGNAIKFTDSGHVLVEVTGQAQGAEACLRVSVTDTGIGIPADKLKLVFEKFSQVDGSSTRRHEGTGLGLAITSRLVALMGGEIGVESEEGKGSTFWFTLALPVVASQKSKKVMPVDVTGARILIVDDNAVNRSILMEQTRSWGFDSCAAQSGSEGLKVLEAASTYGLSVDCMILDYQMPGLTGADVARTVRSTGGISDTPIILLTSVDQSLSNVQCRDLGIDAHLIKPARSSQLLETLVSTIQRKRAPVSPVSVAKPAGPAIETTGPAEPSPVPANPPTAEAPREKLFPRPSGMPRHRVDILVAEDNEVNQLVFQQILSDTPFKFEIVGNGRLAVEAYRTMNPRMILMDVSMPEMNGHEATGAIRQMEAGSDRHVPIVGVTAHALKGDRERCLEAGMDDYLSKPISPNALLEKVQRWAGDEASGVREAG